METVKISREQLEMMKIGESVTIKAGGVGGGSVCIERIERGLAVTVIGGAGGSGSSTNNVSFKP